MTGLGKYLFSIIVAAIFISLIRPLLDGKGPPASIGKMLCGVFLLFTIVKPLTSLRIENSSDFLNPFQEEAALIVQDGKTEAKNAMATIIRQQVEAYIMDKAAQYNAALSVTVVLSEDLLPVPVGVTIQGNISPYGKKQLQSAIASDLGIAKEDQIWK